MKHVASLALAASLAVAASAETAPAPDLVEIIQPAGDFALSDFLWLKRPVIVFADSAADPRYVEQMQLLTQQLDELERRDVIVLTDTDPAAAGALRTKLRPRGFMLVLISKDGVVALRKPLPWSVRELSRSIDKMPIRQREIDDRRGSNR